jgi:hypothetical protein
MKKTARPASFKRKSQSRPAKKPKLTLYGHFSTGKGSGPQLKRQDTGPLAIEAAIAPTQAASLLCGLAQGDPDNARDGNHVWYKSIEVKVQALCGPPATGYYAGDFIRCVLFYDKMPKGAAPLWSDLIFNQGNGASTASDPPRFTNKDRFLILNDWCVSTPDFIAGVAAGVPTAYNLGPTLNTTEKIQKWYHNFNFDLDTMFSGTGATIASINQGAFFVLTQGSVKGTTNSAWAFEITASLTYSDSITKK